MTSLVFFVGAVFTFVGYLSGPHALLGGPDDHGSLATLGIILMALAMLANDD